MAAQVLVFMNIDRLIILCNLRKKETIQNCEDLEMKMKKNCELCGTQVKLEDGLKVTVEFHEVAIKGEKKL